MPEDLSIVGGGGGEVIGLTCTQPNQCDLGRQATKALLRAIETGDKHKPEDRVVPYQWKDGRTAASLG